MSFNTHTHTRCIPETKLKDQQLLRTFPPNYCATMRVLGVQTS